MDSRKSHLLDYEWLALNRSNPEYVGKWVCIKGGRLIGADVSKLTLQSTLPPISIIGALFVRLEPYNKQ